MSKAKRNESRVLEKKLLKESEMEAEKEAPKKLSRMEFVKGATVGAAAAAGAGVLAGCASPQGGVGSEGPVGPAGPAGAAGPQGEPAIPVVAEKELSCDVLVVGGGTSGFTAAVKAATDGAEVIVIEKNPEIGGEGMVSGSNATFGGGTDYQKEAGITDTPELFYEQRSKWDPAADPEVLKAFCDNTVAVCHFLRDLGVEWRYNPAPTPDAGDPFGRTHTVVGGGPALYSVMRPALEDAGGTILTDTAGVRLLTDAKGTVIGAQAKDKDGYFNIKAKCTVLTCGGFQGNVEMMTRYVSPDAVYALLRGLATNSGDGVLMGLEVRAGTKAMERVHGYVHIAPDPIPYPFHPFDLPGNPPDGKHLGIPGILFFGFAHCIVVNIRGERFADESRPRVGEQMCNALMRQPGVRGFNISDAPLYDQYVKASVEDANSGWPELGYGAPKVEMADTIEELARKIEVNPSILGATVSEFNQAVRNGTTHLLRIPKANKDPVGVYEELGLNFVHAIETPPFYAVPVIAGYSHSNGGLAIDGKCQVVDREWKPISGLYAAGDTAVLWHSNYAQGYAQAHTLGYIAGTSAAAAL